MGILDCFRKPEYLYHGTRLDRIPNIKTEGLDPKYFTSKVVFLSNNAGFFCIFG